MKQPKKLLILMTCSHKICDLVISARLTVDVWTTFDRHIVNWLAVSILPFILLMVVLLMCSETLDFFLLSSARSIIKKKREKTKMRPKASFIIFIIFEIWFICQHVSGTDRTFAMFGNMLAIESCVYSPTHKWFRHHFNRICCICRESLSLLASISISSHTFVILHKFIYISFLSRSLVLLSSSLWCGASTVTCRLNEYLFNMPKRVVRENTFSNRIQNFLSKHLQLLLSANEFFKWKLQLFSKSLWNSGQIHPTTRLDTCSYTYSLNCFINWPWKNQKFMNAK